MNANKIQLNVAKTGVILFKPKNKQLDTDVKLKLCTKRLHSTTHVRYLGILIDDRLNWNTHTNNIVSKLMRSNSMLSKLRYVNKEILRTIYSPTFHSYLIYAVCSIGTNKNSTKMYNCPSEKSIKNYELHTI